MGSVLPWVGIAAIMVFGFVVLLTAVTYHAPVKSGKPPDPGLAREHRPQREQWRRQAQDALSARRSAVWELALTLRTRAIALAVEWWPRLRHHARGARVRWLTLESTPGQLIAVAAASVIAGCLIVMLE
jgi:hypothetical protein